MKHGVGNNKWLSELFEDRHFWARMRNTQRSDIMHAFFNKEQKERESNVTYFHTIIPCAIKSSIEAQFQHVFTHEKFRKVQTQFREKVNYITRLTESALGFMTYEVVEQVSNSTFNKFIVTYDTILYENVKRRHTYIKSSHDEPLLEPRNRRFDDLVICSQNICEFTSELEEFIVILYHSYDNVIDEMQEYKAKSKEKYLLSHENIFLDDINDLQNLSCVRTRRRLKIDLDQILKNKLQIDAVKFQLLSWTNYELSVQKFKEI
ncbi:hypothetical protein Ahy_A03g013822 [Arachis hypogaea]|uniref:Protein FAR1-RELATED SEQUENCE n=1 Tax=Arachis hypogaea TaxID=3818 RepID=A0A445DWG3_ARAHY|nr:hypothetical protein Ahy_A03g013822 [Arachis hypogaea]